MRVCSTFCGASGAVKKKPTTAALSSAGTSPDSDGGGPVLRRLLGSRNMFAGWVGCLAPAFYMRIIPGNERRISPQGLKALSQVPHQYGEHEPDDRGSSDDQPCTVVANPFMD